MSTRRAMLLALALWSGAVTAGHGLMNSFGDLEWLPEPGRTPDQWQYPLETLRERSALWMADTPSARFELCLSFMRDKLAELEAMVGRQHPAASVALARYHDYLDQANAVARSAQGDDATALTVRLARSVLEHQYMLSVDYVDMPTASRETVATLIDELARRYGELRGRLPRATAESLFFKEEEVRWSWEMARRDAPP